MDTEIDEALMELLKLKNHDCMGIDVRIRNGKSTEFSVSHTEEGCPENTTDDDIARLKEKLELLEKIRKMQEIMEKFNEEHPGFVPVRYPEIVPYEPWPIYPWAGPLYYKTGTSDGTARINWEW